MKNTDLHLFTRCEKFRDSETLPQKILKGITLSPTDHFMPSTHAWIGVEGEIPRWNTTLDCDKVTQKEWDDFLARVEQEIPEDFEDAKKLADYWVGRIHPKDCDPFYFWRALGVGETTLYVPERTWIGGGLAHRRFDAPIKWEKGSYLPYNPNGKYYVQMTRWEHQGQLVTDFGSWQLFEI